MKYFVWLLCALLSFASCSKVMDTKPLDSYSGDAIWSDYNLAEGYVYSAYSNTIGYIFSWDYDAITKSIKTHPWGGNYISQKTEQIDRFTDNGWSQFSNIRRVNLILENVPRAGFTKSQHDKLLGEGYFLRGAIYSYLAFRFGGVQIVKDVLQVDSDFQIPRSSLKETYDFILADLDSAALLLPVSSERGRATKGAAYALKMRVGLQAGAYLGDNSYYTQVIQAGNALFALGKYSLDEYANMFNAYGSAVASPENILISERRNTNTDYTGTPMQLIVCNSDMVPSKLTDASRAIFPLKESLEGWMNYAPSQDLVDDYLVTDVDGKEKNWEQTSYIATGRNVHEKIYTKRDKRFYASIIYDSSKYFNNWAYMRANGNVSSTIAPLNGGVINGGGGQGSETGYLFNKYVYQDKKLWYSDRVDFCYSVLRLGEAYLNYAEAALVLGDEATAREYITRTYQKHGGFANSITSTGEDLWNEYKRERHIDLVMETGDRYWSLLRWGIRLNGGLKQGYENSALAIPELNGSVRSIAISADGKSYAVFTMNERNGQPLKFSPRRYLFPVPDAKIQALPILQQNAGW